MSGTSCRRTSITPIFELDRKPPTMRKGWPAKSGNNIACHTHILNYNWAWIKWRDTCAVVRHLHGYRVGLWLDIGYRTKGGKLNENGGT